MKAKATQVFLITSAFLTVLTVGCVVSCLTAASAYAESSDASDAVLLYDADLSRNSDKMFEAMCGYFGLKLRKVDVSLEPVTDSLFVDENGLPIRVAAINALVLCGTAGWVDSSEVSILTRRVDSGLLNLLVTDVLPSAMTPSFAKLSRLTHGEVTGVTTPALSTKNYSVAVSRPDISRELTGQSFTYNEQETDVGVALAAEHPHVTELVTSNDASATPFPIFVVYSDSGCVFVSSGTEYRNPGTAQLISLFNERYFSGAVLLALFIKFAGGEECWHRDFDLANFTIDDPPLTTSLGNFSYAELLTQMIQHNFHTTIAFEPWHFLSSEASVVSLFSENPDHLSLVEHGNNADGYEFYRYVTEPGDTIPARPITEQETDIVEGMYRMRELERIAGLHSGRIMVFPDGPSPEQTYSLLKRYNFLATVNGSVTACDLPLGATMPTNFSFDMYPACLDYDDFTAMFRWAPSANFGRVPLWFLLDKPVLTYEHIPYFNSTMNAFNSFADRVNSLNANVIWASLEYVSTHNWLMKENDDGTYDVMLFGRKAIVSNTSSNVRVLHLRKKEDFALPILAVTVDGTPWAYSVDDSGRLVVDVELAPGDSADVEIQYGQGDIDFAVSRNDLVSGFVPAADSIHVPVHNLGSLGGAVVAEFFTGDPSSGGVFVSYAVLWIPGGGTSIASVPWSWSESDSSIFVRLDPYDVTQELREDNNQASLRVQSAVDNHLAVTATQPNPFTSMTQISFDIPFPPGTTRESSPLPILECELHIADLSGRQVARLFEGFLTPGTHFSTWNGKNDEGVRVTPGIYLCVLESRGSRNVHKIVYLK